MVHEELHLHAFGRRFAPRRDQRGIVDEHIETLVALLELVGEFANRLGGGKIRYQKIQIRARMLAQNLVARTNAAILFATDHDDARA